MREACKLSRRIALISSRDCSGWRWVRQRQVVSTVPAPSDSTPPPSSAQSTRLCAARPNTPACTRPAISASSCSAPNLPPQPVKRKSVSWKPSAPLRRVIGPESRSQVSSYGSSTKRTRARSAPAARINASAWLRTAASGTKITSDSKRVTAAASAAYVVSTEARRSAQSVSACGHAISTAACGSHSAGRRRVESFIGGVRTSKKTQTANCKTPAVPVTRPRDCARGRWRSVHRRRIGVVTGRRVEHGMDHVALFEVHDELRVVPAVDHRVLGAVAAAWSELALRRAVLLFHLRHAHAAAGQVHALFLLHAVDEQVVAAREGRSGGADGQQAEQRQAETMIGHDPLSHECLSRAVLAEAIALSHG